MGYLGFWVTRDSVKPINKKVEAITNMKPPTSQKVLSFIGVINHYRDMWPRQSHMLAPLTELTYIKIIFKCTQVKQYSYDKIKRIAAQDTLLTYPDFNEEFKIHTDSIKFQLGAVIIQKGKPIALYSRKRTEAR